MFFLYVLLIVFCIKHLLLLLRSYILMIGSLIGARINKNRAEQTAVKGGGDRKAQYIKGKMNLGQGVKSQRGSFQTKSGHPALYFRGGTFLWIFYAFSVLCLLCLCARLCICALWSPAGKGLTSCLSFVVYNCEFATFPLVSWVRCGTCLYRFLIFAPLLTYISF